MRPILPMRLQAMRMSGRCVIPAAAITRITLCTQNRWTRAARPEAFRVLNALNLVDISNNLGDTKSLACHPASTTHRALNEEERASMGLDESWIRLSVGLEDVSDLEADILSALSAMAG